MIVRDLLDLEAAAAHPEALARLSFALNLAASLDDLGHDLRSPLQNLVTLISLLETAPGSAAVIEPARKLLTGAGDKVEALVGAFELPDLSRRDPEPLSLREAVIQAARLWPVSRLFKHRRLEIGLSRDLPAVLADRSALVVALWQLLQNAGEAIAGQQDGLTVVDAELVGERVWVTISDNGAGLPAARGDLFAHGVGTKRGDHHLGIGLGLARTLLGGMDALLELAPAPAGRGTRARLGLRCLAS